jgi:hypothetical protein
MIPAVAGCQKNPGAPPLRVTYRKATIPSKGLVIGLTNTGTESMTLNKVYVRSKSDKEDRPYDQLLRKVLEPDDSIAIGWMELDGWKIQKGDRLRVFFNEYAQPLEITVGEDVEPDD